MLQNSIDSSKNAEHFKNRSWDSDVLSTCIPLWVEVTYHAQPHPVLQAYELQNKVLYFILLVPASYGVATPFKSSHEGARISALKISLGHQCSPPLLWESSPTAMKHFPDTNAHPIRQLQPRFTTWWRHPTWRSVLTLPLPAYVTQYRAHFTGSGTSSSPHNSVLREKDCTGKHGTY